MAYGMIGAIGECTLANSNYSFVHGNPCALMTLGNVVMLCDDVHITGSYTSGNTIMTLPDSAMFPDHDILVPIVTTRGTTNYARYMKVKTDGTISVLHGTSDFDIHFDGILFHVNNKYYTPAIGNIYDNGSSPLTVGRY